MCTAAVSTQHLNTKGPKRKVNKVSLDDLDFDFLEEAGLPEESTGNWSAY